MNREEQKTTELSTEVRARPRRGNVLWESFKEGCRYRAAHNGAIVLDLIVGGIAMLFAMTHVAFGVYPFSLALLFASSARLLPILIGGAVGCTFIGNVGILYLILHVMAFLLRIVLSYPRSGGDKDPEPRLFGEEPVLRVVGAVILGVLMALYELILFGAQHYTLLFAAGAALFIPLCALLFTFSCAQNWSVRAYLGREMPPATSYFGRNAPFLFALGGMALCFAVAYSLRPIYFFGLSLSGMFISAATLFVARRFGAARGCAAGLLVGLAGGPLYLPAYGLLGLLSGLYASIGMPLSVAAAVLSGGGYAAYVGGLAGFLSVVPEMTMTSLLLFVPLGQISSDKVAPTRDEQVAEARGEREEPRDADTLACLSGALSSVSVRLKQAAVEERTPRVEDYERLCRLSQERICRRCPGEGMCGERDAVEEALRTAVIRLSIGEGAGDGSQSPCEGYGKMLDEIRREAARLAQRKRQGGTKDVLSSDYALLSEVLSEISASKREREARDASAEAALRDALSVHGITADEISVLGKRHKQVFLRGLHSGAGRTVEGEWVEDACVRACGRSVAGVKFSYDAGTLSASTQSRRIFSVEGETCTLAGNAGECAADRALTLTSGGGIAYAVLCDGMGSGKSAAAAATLAASVLSDLLSADVGRALALSLLNNAICASEEECSVALDLLSLDLYEGRACFLKSGAAASFVFRDGALFRIRSRTIPLGLLRIVDSEEASFEVRAGDMMVLLSDGVLGENEEGGWLKEVLAGGGDSATLARRIVESAVRRGTSSDDKTAVVLRVREAKEN